MIIINTNNFWGGIDAENGICVSIARTQPKEFNLPTIKSAMPSSKLLNDWNYKLRYKGKLGEEIYKQRFLRDFDPLWFIKEIKNFMLTEKNKKVTLCCWCRGRFCHRKLIIERIKKNAELYGIRIGEVK